MKKRYVSFFCFVYLTASKTSRKKSWSSWFSILFFLKENWPLWWAASVEGSISSVVVVVVVVDKIAGRSRPFPSCLPRCPVDTHTHTQLDTVESNSCAKLVNWLVFSVFSWTNTATGLVVVFLFSTGWSMTLFFLSTESKFSLSLNGRRAFAILCWQKGNDNPSLCDDLLNKQKYSCFGGCFDCIYLTSNSYSLANKRLDSRRFYVTS